MAEAYEIPLTDSEKNLVRRFKCPCCHDNEKKGNLYADGRYVYCTNGDDPENEYIGACEFWTSRDWLKFQLGEDVFPLPQPLRPLKKHHE